VQTPTGGKWPRHFAIDPSGEYLLVANQNSNNVVVFKIDKQSGEMKPTKVVVKAPSPVCLVFLAVAG
jgi:6-phosphogluconolactonase